MVDQHRNEGHEDVRDNGISLTLFWIGISLIILSFIGGVIAGKSSAEYSDEFSMATAIIYWVSGFVLGFLFIGFSEIINLLQKILDKNNRENLPEVRSTNIETVSNQKSVDGNTFFFLKFNYSEYKFQGFIQKSNLSFIIYEKGNNKQLVDSRIYITIDVSKVVDITKVETKDKEILIRFINEHHENDSISVEFEESSLMHDFLNNVKQ